MQIVSRFLPPQPLISLSRALGDLVQFVRGRVIRAVGAREGERKGAGGSRDSGAAEKKGWVKK